MAREQRCESPAVAAALLRQAHERFLQRDGGARVVTCSSHVAHAVKIGLELRFAAVAHRSAVARRGSRRRPAGRRSRLRCAATWVASNAPCSSKPRCIASAPWRAAACTISWPSTAASSASESSSVSKPRLTAILPPGNAQAFGTELFSTTNSYGSCRSLTAASFWPTLRTYAVSSGSSAYSPPCICCDGCVLLLADRDFLIGRYERELAIAGHRIDHAAGRAR